MGERISMSRGQRTALLVIAVLLAAAVAVGIAVDRRGVESARQAARADSALMVDLLLEADSAAISPPDDAPGAARSPKKAGRSREAAADREIETF